MGRVILATPAQVIVPRTGGVDDRTWASLVDAIGPLALELDESHLALAVADSPRWLWWWTTPAAHRTSWTWDAAVVGRLRSVRLGVEGQAEALRLEPGEQTWPESVPGTGELGIRRELKPHQLVSAGRMLRLVGGANFSVPGAGKTSVAYTTWAGLRTIQDIERCLVVAPLSAHEAWEIEASEIFESRAKPDVRLRPETPSGDVVVVNYERLESDRHRLALRAWLREAPSLVIFDEAHRAKAGSRGVRGAAALDLARSARRRMVLTGTPRPNELEDLVNVLELAYPARGRGLVDGSPEGLRSSYVRVTKDELGLPPMETVLERVPMSDVHERVYSTMVSEAARTALQDPDLERDLARVGRIIMLLLQAATDPTALLSPGSRLTMEGERDLPLEDALRQLPSTFVPSKLVRCQQLVGERAAAGSKVLVWACFRHHIQTLLRLLEPYGPAYVDGSLPVNDPAAPTDRRREIHRFREDPECNVLLATPHTLGEGVSLHQTSTHQIHIDRTFNAGLYLQSLDRTHRLGLPTDADCSATFLVSEYADGQETIDGVVERRLAAKVRAMSEILNDRDLQRLAFPDTEEHLTPNDVLLDRESYEDLRELFAHLHDASR